MQNRFILFLKGIRIVLLVGLFMLVLAYVILDDGVYETTNISDYGNIKGNESNGGARKIVSSFFPEHIDPSFSDITYHYKALKEAQYAFECYLEFVIEDPDLFAAFIDKYIDEERVFVFRYDETFMEYTIHNLFDLNVNEVNETGGYRIENAEIMKVLYSEVEQRVIFYSLGLLDNGLIWTTDLDTFFNRFNIDAMDYWLNAYCCLDCEEIGLITALHQEDFRPGRTIDLIGSGSSK